MGGAEYMTRYEIVLCLARFFDLRPDLVRKISTAATGQKARRPLRSGLIADLLTAELGRPPIGFSEGLERMVQDADFRCYLTQLK